MTGGADDTGTTAALLLPVCRNDKVKGWPKADDDTSPAEPETVDYREAAEAFTARYSTDAHFAPYSAPHLPHRLRIAALACPELAAGWAMALLVTDVDHPWHKEKPTTDDEREDLARRVAAWWAEEVPKLDALDAAHPGGFVYRSRSGGYRLVYRLAAPTVIRTDEDRERWRVRYQRELLYLQRAFRIEGDPACADITRLYRLPCVTRPGSRAPFEPETRGSPYALGDWTHEPSDDELEDDVATARALAALKPNTWGSVLRRIEPPTVKAPKAAPRSQTRDRQPRPPRADGTTYETNGSPPEDEEIRTRMVAYALATLDAVCDRIAAVPGHITGGNNAINAGVYQLARFVPHLLDESEVRARALDAAHRCGVINRDGADGERHALGTIDSAMRAGKRRPRWPDLDVDEPPVSGTVPRLLSAAEGTAAIRAALRSPAALVVLRSTPGCGKSAEAWALVGDRCRGDERTIVTAPTHRLGQQIQAALGALGVPSTRPQGVARVRLPLLDGNGADAPACVHHQAAELLAFTGSNARKELCPGCDARENHPQTGGKCPAFAAGAEDAPVAVMQHALLASLLRQHTELLTAPPAPSEDGKIPPKPAPSEDRKIPPKPARLLVVDEPPPPFLHSPLSGARQQYKQAGLAAELVTEAYERLDHALAAVLRAVEAGGHAGASLRELLTLAGGTPEAVEADLTELRALDGANLWQKDLPGCLARSALYPSGREQALGRLAIVARFSGLLAALVDAAHHPDVPVLRVDEDGAAFLVTRARWTRYLGPYLAAGGRVRLLDATAPVDAFRALWGDALEVASVEVEDAPGVTRRALRWGHAARGRHTIEGQVLAEETRGPLRRLAELVTECSARKIGLLTHKPLADALRGWLAAPPGQPAPAFVPDELAALVGAGVEVSVGHYGAQRGLNHWADCDMLATLGDPWPNLGAARAEAAALGLDPDAWAIEQARAELVQAWGRIRAVHRTAPALVAHFGSSVLAPEPSWAPQWAGVRQERAPLGRPRTVLPLTDPATWAEDRAQLGLSARQHAAVLGLSWRTYGRRDPRGYVETLEGEQGEETPKTPQETVAHNPPLEFSDAGFTGDPGTVSFSIPDYAPPDTPRFCHPDGVDNDLTLPTSMAVSVAGRLVAPVSLAGSQPAPAVAPAKCGPPAGILVALAPHRGAEEAWVA